MKITHIDVIGSFYKLDELFSLLKFKHSQPQIVTIMTINLDLK